MSCPRILVAGLGGGSGKTIVSLGLAFAFCEQGLRVQPFKKGPDYIDANWLGRASSRHASNLDPFLLSPEVLKDLFWSKTAGCDLALIEGNRGLYDGKDVAGTYSSAELAKMLHCPVIMVVDCTKVTRTMAAIVMGLCAFDQQVDIQGVILNRTAGGRHQNILRQTIEKYTDVSVLGALPKLKENPVPERQTGLISEAECVSDPFPQLAELMRKHLDLDACLRIARGAPFYQATPAALYPEAVPGPLVRIGVARDAALWFYYQENLDALAQAGGTIVEFSLLDDDHVPDVDALYLGGGFPELLAGRLSANVSMRQSVQQCVLAGMPVYAECGGLTYLSRQLQYAGQEYPMADVFPLISKVLTSPQGHGYIAARVQAENPFFRTGTGLTGHEFHYSRCLDLEPESQFVFAMERGQGMAQGTDAVLFRNCLAGYTHIHALGVPSWATNFISAARVFQVSQSQGTECPEIRI